ncbi:hypothetical protein SAMN04487965_1794 [Microbulbifer donghaiensis]|uniref:Uncharacterized protein n=1 Tax=Microbulbifer donghaiensis TaxID=494016 RepID=A0A1M5A9M3_9GAMM|nr:hypothetical protein SAMN04487965_1794 [Microbulbifer donghaiensis]
MSARAWTPTYSYAGINRIRFKGLRFAIVQIRSASQAVATP